MIFCDWKKLMRKTTANFKITFFCILQKYFMLHSEMLYFRNVMKFYVANELCNFWRRKEARLLFVPTTGLHLKVLSTIADSAVVHQMKKKPEKSLVLRFARKRSAPSITKSRLCLVLSCSELEKQGTVPFLIYYMTHTHSKILLLNFLNQT